MCGKQFLTLSNTKIKRGEKRELQVFIESFSLVCEIFFEFGVLMSDSVKFRKFEDFKNFKIYEALKKIS